MYEELRNLAQEKSPERRVELLRKVSQAYFESARSDSEAERYIFGDIIDCIVTRISKEHKLDLVPDCDTNVQLARRLANDYDIEVADPVIRRSEALTDDDLIAIAGSRSHAHRNAIASRRTVSEAVSDVLIDRGDRRVAHTLSANEGARFSSRGMERLVDRARSDLDLCDLLVERPDLSPAAADKLLPLVSAGLTARLAERGVQMDGEMSDSAMRDLRRHFTEALRQRRENAQSTEATVMQIRNGSLGLDEAVRGLVAGRRLLDAFAVVSAVSTIDRKYMFSLVTQNELAPLLMVFRALELKWPTVEGLLRLAAHTRPCDRDILIARGAYRVIDPASAQRILRFIRVRRAALGRH